LAGYHFEAGDVAADAAFCARLGRSACDAAYLALAEAVGQPLITGDARVVNAIREHLDWVEWVGDHASTA
jgi:predicted nucleic acid-binding protein